MHWLRKEKETDMKRRTMIRLVAPVLCLILLVLALMSTQQRAAAGQRENRNSSIDNVSPNPLVNRNGDGDYL
jgi:hypothetical protein